jgi:hypothetical protein
LSLRKGGWKYGSENFWGGIFASRLTFSLEKLVQDARFPGIGIADDQKLEQIVCGSREHKRKARENSGPKGASDMVGQQNA